MKNAAITFLFLLFCSCSGQDSTIEGNYKSPKNSKINVLRYGSFVVDAELQLKKDGTYTFSNCSQISNGLWKRQNDELILECKEQKFKIDSFNYDDKYKKGKICYPPMTFDILNEKLERKLNDKEGNYKIILFKSD